ncbi:ran-binding protein 3 [Drosophila albomicans]|uniref:Ran-binding protein 3 n=1 Tax=Drosophila albomicans TaxID=7291 RepID=A0A6P8XQ32_DROAB|nr:ran-binding protein 3 [Drosophila albomicans]
MSENNEASVEANCFRGGFTLKASRLGGAVLRPAVLGDSSVLGSVVHSNNASSNSNSNSNNTTINTNNNNNNSSSTLAAAADAGSSSQKTDEVTGAGGGIVGNPFLREQREEEDDASAAVVESTEKSDKEDDEIDERPDPLTMLRNNGIEHRATNIFAAAKTNLPRMQTSGFIFGQNVHERVVGENVSTEANAEAAVSDSTEATSSQLLFSSVIQRAAQSTDNNKETSEAKSLNDVAREYEESRAQKRKYEEVETFTGEENELNIADVSCKLFAFVNSNWEERGRGSLRLNDAKDEQDCSRVVFRTSGNLRLLLNTKVWAAMVAERASQKSLRLTAMDNTGTVKIFLAMGRPADIAQVHKALSERIAKRKLTHPEECAVVETKNGISSESCAVSVQPESTTNDDDEDGDGIVESIPITAAAGGTTNAAALAEADSIEPSPKKALMQADSSVDVVVVATPDDATADSNAEAEAQQPKEQHASASIEDEEEDRA